MSPRAQRLARVAGCLTPQEAVRAWLQEAQTDVSPVNSLVASVQAPETANPLLRLGRQVEAAVRQARKGVPEEQVGHAVRWAVRDVVFLYSLATDLNFDVLTCQREIYLNLGLVVLALQRALEHDSAEQFTEAWWLAQDLAQRVWVQQGVIETVTQRYFAGTSPLHPQTTELVTLWVSEVEQILAIGHAELRDQAALPPKRQKAGYPAPVDLERLRADLEPSIAAATRRAVDVARSAAWRFVGEWRRSLELLEAQLGPPSP